MCIRDSVHTCQLSTQFYKTALSTSAGVAKLDLSRMKTLIMVLKSNPATNARTLRPLLLPYVNNEQEITATFIRNFRQRVAYFLALQPNFSDLSIDEANSLVSRKYMTEEEHKVLDNPII